MCVATGATPVYEKAFEVQHGNDDRSTYAQGDEEISATATAVAATPRVVVAGAQEISSSSSKHPYSPESPGLLMASLVAGLGGVTVLAVGVAVLQRVCPPVHLRLATAASVR